MAGRMKCPECGERMESKVINTLTKQRGFRETADTIRRRRKFACGHRFNTTETVETPSVDEVIKELGTCLRD